MDFSALLQRIGLSRLIISGGIILVTGWFFYMFFTFATTPDMGLLYGNLEPKDASRIIAKIEERGIPVNVRGDGTQIFVPVDQIPRLRMDLAEVGLPSSDNVGYEIFDKSDVFGTSFFVQNINRLRALEGELSRTIRTLSPIAAARVHIVMPKRELFHNEKRIPTASVVIRMNTASKLDDGQVKAIQHLVSSSVPDLVPDKVAVIDDSGHLLSSGYDGNSENAVLQKNMTARTAYERKVETAINSLLERTLGVGKVRAEVTADLDFDNQTENSEVYNPDGQVPRSTYTVHEEGLQSESATGSGAGKTASATQKLPGGATSSTLPETKNTSKRTEETINYEVTKTVRSLVKGSGAIKKLSIAVLVDGVDKKGADGKVTYQPRSKQEIAQIEKLIKSAVGFDAKRGDTLEVVNMPFTNDSLDAGATGAESWYDINPHDIARIIEVFILGLIGLLILMMVIRPLVSKILEAINESIQQAPAPDIQSKPAAETQVSRPSNDEETVKLNQVEGEVKRSSLKTVSDIIDKHPDETVSLVRNWMNQ